MVFFDLILIFVVFLKLRDNNKLDFLNPVFLFFIYHIFFVSIRAMQILLLDADIIINLFYSDVVTKDEVSTSLLVSDLTLLGFFLGSSLMNNRNSGIGMFRSMKGNGLIVKNATQINKFLLILTILGVFGTVNYAVLPGQLTELENVESNIIISFVTNLGVISALLLVYEKGFKRIYLLYLFLILLVYALQGYHRYRVILPLLFLLMYYLRINNLLLPPLKFVMIGLVVLIFSFPLKQIGKKLQRGENVNLLELGVESANEIIEGESGDLSLFEQSSAMIGSIEKKNVFFWGKTFIPVLFFWIPRSLWNEKPKLNQWQHDISSVGRDYAQMGQVSLLSGESYANFSYFGAFIIPFFLGRFFSRVYNLFRNIHYKHRGFLLLLLLNMILFQVWRDGIISLVIFPFINYLPIVILILLKKHRSENTY